MFYEEEHRREVRARQWAIEDTTDAIGLAFGERSAQARLRDLQKQSAD